MGGGEWRGNHGLQSTHREMMILQDLVQTEFRGLITMPDSITVIEILTSSLFSTVQNEIYMGETTLK